jgi:hypothetical protein
VQALPPFRLARASSRQLRWNWLLVGPLVARPCRKPSILVTPAPCRRSQAAKDPHGLQTLCEDALKDGDTAPAYRAVMTHSQARRGARQAIAA